MWARVNTREKAKRASYVYRVLRGTARERGREKERQRQREESKTGLYRLHPYQANHLHYLLR